MPLGTSMDYESLDSRSKGCWDPAANLTVFYEKWTSPSATPEFVVDDVWCGLVGGIGFGAAATETRSAFWTQTLKEVYKVSFMFTDVHGSCINKSIRELKTLLLGRSFLRNILNVLPRLWRLNL